MAAHDYQPCYIGMLLKEEKECHRTVFTRYV